MPRRSPAAPLIALLVVLAGCGGGDESTSTTVAPVLATLPRVELPAGFPADVPLPAGIELDETNEMAGRDSTIYDITGWNAGEPVLLGEAYLTELRDLGYQVASRSDAVESILFSVEGPEWFVSAGFYPDAVRESGTSIGLTVAPATP